MGKDYETWAPRGRAYYPDGTVPDDPGPWLEQNSPIDLAREYGGSAMREAASIDGPTVAAIAKWFRADRGYGFVELAGGQGDAFLHLKALRLAGLESAPPGAKFRVIVHRPSKFCCA
jgi:cold shock protein